MTFFPRVFCAVFAIAFLGLPGVARPDDTEESKGRAQSILAEAADYLASQEAFAFEAVLTYEGRFSGQEETLVTDYTVAFKRPDAISVRAVNSEMDILFVSDGKEYIRYLPAFKQFMKAEETLSAGEVVAQAGFDIIVPALALMGEMLNSAPFSSTSETGDLVFVGEETVNGIACSHIQFTFGNVAYDVWIQNDGEPMVRRFVPDMTELAQQLGANAGVDFEIQVTADLSKWESGANAEQRTHFDPPENAELVTAFRAPTPADELKGEIAPDFSIALLDGGSLTLSERKGKIVILDFWATWCGPCRVAMPVLVEVSKEFADKGVELYGVNLMEDPEQIRRYLDGQDLDLTVALDSDGAVGNQYRADGIPQTVIVGRDGKVKIVHVGLWAMPDRSAEPSATREGELQLFHDALVKSLRAELKKLVAEEGAAD